MRGHTPGPWFIVNGDEKHMHAVCHDEGSAFPLAYVGTAMTALDKDANAKLISAAPELADALEAVRASAQCGCTLREAESGHRSDCWLPHWLQVAADALRKAGVQP